jgi:hypothetical protein
LKPGRFRGWKGGKGKRTDVGHVLEDLRRRPGSEERISPTADAPTLAEPTSSLQPQVVITSCGGLRLGENGSLHRWSTTERRLEMGDGRKRQEVKTARQCIEASSLPSPVSLLPTVVQETRVMRTEDLFLGALGLARGGELAGIDVRRVNGRAMAIFRITGPSMAEVEREYYRGHVLVNLRMLKAEVARLKNAAFDALRKEESRDEARTSRGRF